MELTTILNRCHHFRGFVYQHARFIADKKSIEVAVRPRRGSAITRPNRAGPVRGVAEFAGHSSRSLAGLNGISDRQRVVPRGLLRRFYGRAICAIQYELTARIRRSRQPSLQIRRHPSLAVCCAPL